MAGDQSRASAVPSRRTGHRSLLERPRDSAEPSSASSCCEPTTSAKPRATPAKRLEDRRPLVTTYGNIYPLRVPKLRVFGFFRGCSQPPSSAGIARDSATTGVELRTPAAVPSDRANGCPGLRLPWKPAAADVPTETPRAAAAAACAFASQTPAVVPPDHVDGCLGPRLPRKPAAAQLPAATVAEASADTTASPRRSRCRRRQRRRCPPTAEAPVAAASRRSRRQRRRSSSWRIVDAGAGRSRPSKSPKNGDVPLPPRAKPSPDGTPSARGENASHGGARSRISRPGTDTLGFRSPPDPPRRRSWPTESRQRRRQKPTARSRAWRAMHPVAIVGWRDDGEDPGPQGTGFRVDGQPLPPLQENGRWRLGKAVGEQRPCDEVAKDSARDTAVPITSAARTLDGNSTHVDAGALVRAYDRADLGDWAASLDHEDDVPDDGSSVVPGYNEYSVRSDGTMGVGDLRRALDACDAHWDRGGISPPAGGQRFEQRPSWSGDDSDRDPFLLSSEFSDEWAVWQSHFVDRVMAAFAASAHADVVPSAKEEAPVDDASEEGLADGPAGLVDFRRELAAADDECEAEKTATSGMCFEFAREFGLV